MDLSSDINLFHGECEQLLPSVPDNSVDMVICDLPYGTTQCDWDSLIDLDFLWREYERVCKDNAAILLFAQTPFDKVIGVSKLNWLRYEWIWEKPLATGFFNAKKMPLKAHENILVFYKKLPKFYPQMTSGHVRRQSSRNLVGSDVYGKAFNKTDYDSTDRYPRSVQLVSKGDRKQSYHPTEKPVALYEYLIRSYTDEGETVLDNTMGSGTGAIACLNSNRRFIGMEKSPIHFETAEQRLAEARKQPDFFISNEQVIHG